MKSTAETGASNLKSNAQPLPGVSSFILRALWIIPGATLLIFLIFISLGYIQLSGSGRHLVAIFVYTACIAPLSMLLLTGVATRYTCQFPRTILLIEASCLTATASVGCLAGDLVLWMVGICPHNGFWIEYWQSLPFSIVITLVIGLSITTYETLRSRLRETEIELRTREAEQERAHKLLAEARLSSVESSIHPHFLFNTLNSIAALIPTDPQRAEDTVGKLASLLRFSLNAQHTGLVPLKQELKVVRDYLEIEATRFGPRLRYEILVPDSLDSVKVPPLSLQTLVENSVKHVAAQRTEGASIQVRAGKSDCGSGTRCVCLEVIDDGAGFSLGAVTSQHSLGNLMARLDLLFGGEGRLDVVRVQDHTMVRISVPEEA